MSCGSEKENLDHLEKESGVFIVRFNLLQRISFAVSVVANRIHVLSKVLEMNGFCFLKEILITLFFKSKFKTFRNFCTSKEAQWKGNMEWKKISVNHTSDVILAELL